MATSKHLIVKDKDGNELTLWINNNNEIFIQSSDDDGYNDMYSRWICLCKEDAIELYNELGNLIKEL